MSKWTLKEAVSVSALDKNLLQFKQPIRSKLSGEIGEYVDILEFVVDWLANRSTAQDADFQAFMDKLGQSYEAGKAEKGGSVKTKAAKIKQIEKEPGEVEINPDDVEIDNEKPAPKKAAAPKAPSAAAKAAKKPSGEKPKFGAAPDAPSLSTLAGQGDDSFWDKATKNAQDLYKKMPSDEPKAAEKPAEKPQASKPAAVSKDWKPGDKVDAGAEKGLTVKGKKAGMWHLGSSDGKEFLFDPRSNSLKKFSKAG